MSLTQELIALIRSKPVSDQDLQQAALFSLDAIACAYAGSATGVGEILRGWAAQGDMDGKRQALLMGALTHITETDDLHRASVTHPGCVVVPAVLSLGAKLGSGNEQMLIAILHGFEAMCRIGAAVGPSHYKVWHNTATCGPFGSAMAAATLLALDDEQTLDALGNAGTQSSGFWQFMETGAMSKHLHAGRACESGMLAAELAAQGFTGSPEILEGKKGFFAAMCADPKPSNILDDAGASWQLRLTSIKPWPSCRHTHPIIDCALELHPLLDGNPVQKIEIRTYQAALDVCDYPEPETEYQAKFSLYHTAAIALLDGEVGLDSFNSEARARSASLRRQTRVSITDPYAASYPVSWGAEVVALGKSGENFKTSRKHCKGDPELALDNGELRIKAIGLLQHGGLNENQAGQLCDSVLAMPGNKSPTSLFPDFINHVRS
ncbi:MAG: MmgE/PrpD family protein [Gammaproteobacteria bacterium]|nr:MmgE/PrpD family protein [Gammaproteobacteria bacterium]